MEAVAEPYLTTETPGAVASVDVPTAKTVSWRKLKLHECEIAPRELELRECREERMAQEVERVAQEEIGGANGIEACRVYGVAEN